MSKVVNILLGIILFWLVSFIIILMLIVDKIESEKVFQVKKNYYKCELQKGEGFK